MSSPSFAAIPPADPRANYLAHREEIDAAIARVLAAGRYVLGSEVSAFEAELATYFGVPHAIGCASGTDAIVLALRACGIGAGDEVITVAHTAVATVAAIEIAGATPVLADVEPRTLTLDPVAAEAAVTSRTRALLPVHLYGHPADLEALAEIARRHRLRLIEDAAQAQGARVGERKAGAWGDIAATSFYPTKNLGALGDGGAVITADPELAERVRLLREYGWRTRDASEIAGMNSRLDELQAAILRIKLRSLDAENAKRRALAEIYREALEDTDLALPETRPGCAHVFHQFVVRHPRRDPLRDALRAQGIGTLIHYPVPVHLQPAYRGRLRISGSLAHTEAAAATVLSLPMFPELEAGQARRVAEAIREWARNVPV